MKVGMATPFVLVKLYPPVTPKGKLFRREIESFKSNLETEHSQKA